MKQKHYQCPHTINQAFIPDTKVMLSQHSATKIRQLPWISSLPSDKTSFVKLVICPFSVESPSSHAIAIWFAKNFNLNLHYVGPLQKYENSFYYTLKRYQTFVHANTTISWHLRPTYVDVRIVNTFLFSTKYLWSQPCRLPTTQSLQLYANVNQYKVMRIKIHVREREICPNRTQADSTPFGKQFVLNRVTSAGTSWLLVTVVKDSRMVLRCRRTLV